jgi:hypothetical protein
MSSPAQGSKDENPKVFTMIYPILALLFFLVIFYLARKTQHRNNLFGILLALPDAMIFNRNSHDEYNNQTDGGVSLCSSPKRQLQVSLPRRTRHRGYLTL